MTNSTLLSRGRSKLKLDPRKKAGSTKFISLLGSVKCRLKTFKGLVALLIPLFITASTMALPIIQTQPGLGPEVCVTSAGSLTVVATAGGGGNIAYQWQKVTNPADTASSVAWTNIVAGYSGTYSAPTLLIGAGADLSLYYRCVLVETGGSSPGSRISRAGYLTVVNGIPTFSVTPTATTVCQGSDATFAVTLNGPTTFPQSITYQWQIQDSSGINTANNAGSATTASFTNTTLDTTNTFTFLNTVMSKDDQDQVRVVVTNVCGADTTGFATLSVDPIPHAVITTSSPQNRCQAASTTPSVTVSNAKLSTRRASANVNWTINYTFYNGTTNTTSNLTVNNSGNTAVNLVNLGGGVAAGCYVWDLSNIINTSSGVVPTCRKNLSSQIQANVYPAPVVTFENITDPVDVCEGNAATFKVIISNTTYACYGVTSGIAWTGTFGSQLQEGSAGGFTITPAFSGIGDGTFTFTTSSLSNDDYRVGLLSLATTGVTCNAAGLPIYKQLRSFPQPAASMGGNTSQDACQTATITIPAINVTNTNWNGPGAATTPMNWSLSISDPTGNLAATVGGNGNATPAVASSSPASPAVGCHIVKLNSVTLTNTPGATPNPPSNPTCINTISSEQKTFNIYPNPVVSFTAGPVDVCETNTASFTVTVSNATRTCNSVTSNLNWGGTFQSQKQEGGAGGFSISPGLSGAGYGTFTFTTSALANDDYRVALSAFALTSAPSCAASTGLPIFKQIRSFPQPDASLSSTTTQNVCQSGNITLPTVNVLNAVWNGPSAGSTNMNWSLSVTDETGNLANTYTGFGNGSPVVSSSPAAPAVGCYNLKLNSIALTNTAGATPNPPTHPTCPRTISGQSKNYVVQSEPVVTISPASPNNNINLCEGTGGSFTITVSNSQFCAAPRGWALTTSETFEAAANGSAPGASTVITSLVNVSGSGNGSQTVNIPSNLAPGQYVFVITAINSTGAAPNCAGTIGSGTIHINVYPKPTITLSPATETICEGNPGTVTFTITNTYFDPSAGTPLIVGNLPGHFTYNLSSALGGTIPSTPVAYGGSTTSITSGPYTTSTALTAGTYTLNIDQITIDNPSCTYNVTTSDLYTLTVQKTPVLTINSVTPKTCLNTTATINYSVSNINPGVAWSFSYTSSGGGFAGVQTISGTGPATNVNITTPTFVTSGTKNLIFTPPVTSGLTPNCTGTTPANVPITIVPLPDVTGLVATSTRPICSGGTVSFDVTVNNMVAGLTSYGWTITYNVVQTAPGTMNILTGQTVTGTGIGTFNFTIPGTQRHFLANGDSSARRIVITSIAHTSSSPGGEPLCTNNSPTQSVLRFSVEPMPRINIKPRSQNVCVTSTGIVDYTVTGVRASKTWSFKWHNDNPSTSPTPITGSGSISGGGTGSFNTNGLANPGFATIFITDLRSTSLLCDSTSTYDDTTRFIVNPPSFADTLTPNYIKCEDNNSNVIGVKNPGLIVGTVQGWDSSHDNGFTWLSFPSTGTVGPLTSSSFTFQNIRYTTQYRLRVRSGVCPVAYSRPAQIFIDPRPKIEIIDNALTHCSGNNVTLTVLVSGVKSTETWTAGFTHTGTPSFTGPISGTGSGTFSFTIATSSTTSHSVVINGITNNITGCTNFPAMSTPFNTFNATVASTSVAGNIYNGTITAGTVLPQTVCKGSTITLRHGNHAGSVSPVTTWYWSTASSPSYPNDWDSTENNSSSLVVNTTPATTKYMVRVKSGSCNSTRSNIFDLNVRNLPTASFDAPRYKRICEGSSIGNALTVNGSPSLGYSIGYNEGGSNYTLTGTTNSSGVHATSITTASLNASTNVIMNSIAYTTAPTCPQPLYTDAISEIVVLKNPKFQVLTVDTPVCLGNKTNYSYNIFDISSATGLTATTTTIDALENGASSTTGTAITGISVSGNGVATKQTANTLGTSGIRWISLTRAQTVYTFSTSPTTVTCDTAYNSAKSFLVWPTTVAGTITGTATVCKGSNSGSVVQSTAGTGTIIRWESSINGGSTWSPIANTTTTQAYSNITVTTMYRAVYKSGNCAEAMSGAITITVNELPTATISISSTNSNICSGTNGTYTITTTNTSGQTWSLNVIEGATSRTITGTGNTTTNFTTASTLSTNTTISLVNITTTGSPSCGPNTVSGDATFTVIPRPSVTLNSVTTPVCAGSSTFATFQITTSNIASGVGFSVKYDVGSTVGLTYTNTGSGTFTVTTSAPALSSAGTYNVKITEITTTGLATNCNSFPTGASMNVVADAASTAGTVTSSQTVCKGSNSGTLTVAGHNGSVVRWEYSTNSGSSWTVVSNTTTSLSFSNITATTQYRAVTKNSTCSEINSSVATITVNELPTASISISSTNNTICAGTPGTYTITTNNTYGQTWSLQVIEGATARTVTGTGNTTVNFTTSANLNSNTSVSLVSITTTGSPSCGPNTISGDVTFTVTPRPSATLNSVTTPVCVGSSTFASFQITTSNIANGVGFAVTYSIGSTTGLTYTNTGSGTFNVVTTSPALSTSGTYTVTLTSITTTGTAPNCSATPTGPSRDIVVDAISVAGTVISAQSIVCKGANSGTVSVGGHNGSVVRWEFSTNGGSTWTTISNTSTSLSFNNLTTTTQYRAVTKNNSCSEINATPVTITVQEVPVATITGSTTICAQTTATLTINISNVSAGQRSNVTYLEGTTTKTVTIFGTSGTITTSSLTGNTDVTLATVSSVDTTISSVFLKGCQNSALTSTATVNVNPLPNATLNSLITPICVGNASSFEFTVSNIATGQGWSLTYTEGSTSKTTTGNGPGTYTVNTNTLSTAGTVTINLVSISTTSFTPNCTRALTGQTMNIIVDANTTVGTLGSDVTVCRASNSGNLTYNVGSSNGALVRWESSTLSSSGPWTSITNSTNTQAYLNIAATTYFRVVVKNGKCNERESNVITISVQEIPVASVGGSNVICAGNTASLNVSITNVSAGQRSILTYLEGTTSKTVNIFGTSGTLVTNVLNTNTDITLVSVTSIDTTISSVFRKGCSNTGLFSTATVNVNPLPTATLSSVGGPICQGNSTTYVTTVTNVPTGQGWTLAGTIEGSTIVPTPSGTGSGTFTFNTMVLNNPPSASVKFSQITNTTTGCLRILTESKDITVDATTTVGVLSGTATVCKGSNSGSLTFAKGTSNGNVVRWESSTTSASGPYSGISNTSSTQTYSNLTATTWYRTVVKNGACAELVSNVQTVTVRELPMASISGATTICEGSSANYTITASNTFGQTFRVYYLIGSRLDSLERTGDGTYTLNTGTLTSTTDITLSSIAQLSGSPQCSQTLSGTITITVNELPRVSFANVPTRLCTGSKIGFTVDVSKVKSTENWTMTYTVKAPSSSGAVTESTSGSGSGNVSITTSTSVSPTTSTLSFATITNTSTGCSNSLTDSKVIDVDPTTVGGSLSTSTKDTVCKGANTGTLSLTGQTGNVIRWESSTDNGATWSTINSTSSSLTYNNITLTTRYRAVVQSGVCATANSGTLNIIVRDLPMATVNNVTICARNRANLTVSVSNTFGKPWSLTFAEGSTTRTLTGTGDGNFTLQTNVLFTTTTISLKSIVITSGTVLCSNTGLTGVGVVTVNPLPAASHDNAPTSVCDGSTVDFTVNVDNVVTGQNWLINYRINPTGSINTKTGTGPGNFTITSPVFSNSSSTMRVDQIQITSISNLSTGCTRDTVISRSIDVYPKSIGGTTSASVNPLCANSNTSSNITVTGFVGQIIRWEYSDDNTTWTTLSNTNSLITVSNLSKTRDYRAVVQSGPCLSANSTSVKVVVIPTVEAEISGAPQICAGKTAQFNILVSNIGINDNWVLLYRVNGSAQLSLTGKGPGNFPLIVGPPVTNSAGLVIVKLETITNTTFNCANINVSSQAIATVNPNPKADFTFVNSCKDSVAVFNNTSTIANGVIADYNWNFGDGGFSKDGNPTHAYTNTGNYSVSLLAVSALGCRDSITKTITVNPRPVAEFSFKNTCQDTAVKFTNETTIAAGGGIKSYFWNFGDGGTDVNINPTHKYTTSGTFTVTLTVVSNNGCASTKVRSITIYTLPEPNFVANPVCQNSAMSFINTSSIGVGTMSYKWDFAGQGSLNTTQTNPTHTFTGLGYGLFNVALTATSNNGCVKTLLKPVTVWANPVANYTVADVCIGEPSKFINTSTMPAGSADIIQEYFWSFGDSSFSTGKDPIHKYAKAGIYSSSVKATSDKGCINTIAKSVVVNSLPTFNIVPSKDKFCDGDTATLTAKAGMRLYQWSTGATTPSIVVRQQGWYKVRVFAPFTQGGCSYEDSIFITVWPLPIADAGRDTTIDKGQTVVLNGKGAGLGGSYLWSPSSFLTPIANTAKVFSKPTENITYTLRVTDLNGCIDTDTVNIKVRQDFVLIVRNIVTPNGDGKNDFWFIDNIEFYPTAKVSIFNRYGMEIFKTEKYKENWDGTKDAPGGEPLPDGAYYYVITMDGSDVVYKGAISLIRSEVK